MKTFTKESLKQLKEKFHTGRILMELFGFIHATLPGVGITPTFIYGECPFCEEEDSMFNLIGTSICTCFNCNFHGDAIDLLMGAKKWSFQETVEYLAKRFHVELEETKRTPLTKEQRIKRKQDYREAIRMMEEVEPGSVDKKLKEIVEKMQ